MKNIFRSVTCILLTLVTLFLLSSTAIGQISACESDTLQNNSQASVDGEIFEKADAISQSLYSRVTAETVREDNDFLAGVIPESEYLEDEIKALLSDIRSDAEQKKERSAFSLALDCIFYDIGKLGFTVFTAVASVDGKQIPGVAFTDCSLYAEEDGEKVYSCGFLQVYRQGEAPEVILDSDTVRSGVIVLPVDNPDGKAYVINTGAELSGYSAIYNGKYIRYGMAGDYSVAVTVQDEKEALFDETVDLYDFDRNRLVFRGQIGSHKTDAIPLYSEESAAFAAARSAVEQIISYQESNAYRSEIATVILISEDVLNQYLIGKQQGAVNGFLLEDIKNTKLESNQFLVVTTDGVSIHTVEKNDEASKARAAKGIVGIIGSLLLIGVSAFVAVASYGAGTPVLVTAIATVTGVGASLYGASNLIESSYDLYYGLKGDIVTPSYNPILDGFSQMCGDKELGSKLYHAWGLSQSLIQALVIPAGAAFNVASSAGATVWQTTLAVSRAIVVEIAKITVTSAVSIGVGTGVYVGVESFTDSEWMAIVASAGSTLAAGLLSYRGLSKLDTRYNLSGLYSKSTAIRPNEQYQSDNVVDRQISRNARTDPASLREELAMAEIKSDPTHGNVIMNKLDDPMLPPGSVKMSYIHRTDSTVIEIHYVRFTENGVNYYTDFKFKNLPVY